MKFFATIASAALFASAFAQQNGLTINSLDAVTICRPSLITWTGGTPPYFLSIQPAGQPSAQPLVDFGRLSSNSITWNVNLRAGTAGYLNLRDSTGAVGQSATFTVQTGSDTACLNSTLSVSAGPAATGSQSGGSASSSSQSASKTASASGTSASHSAALSQYNIGVAAVIGAVALAFAA